MSINLFGPEVAANRFTVRVRPVRPDDAPLLADIFDRLSPASRLTRFLVPKRELSATELRYFTDLDHHNHEALIAITRLGGVPIGVARFIRDRDEPSWADVAVEVVDDWQNRGVGSLLARRLADRAQRVDVSVFTALVSVDNVPASRLLRKVGCVTHINRDGATRSYRAALGPCTANSRHRPRGHRPVGALA